MSRRMVDSSRAVDAAVWPFESRTIDRARTVWSARLGRESRPACSCRSASGSRVSWSSSPDWSRIRSTIDDSPNRWARSSRIRILQCPPSDSRSSTLRAPDSVRAYVGRSSPYVLVFDLDALWRSFYRSAAKRSPSSTADTGHSSSYLDAKCWIRMCHSLVNTSRKLVTKKNKLSEVSISTSYTCCKCGLRFRIFG